MLLYVPFLQDTVAAAAGLSPASPVPKTGVPLGTTLLKSCCPYLFSRCLFDLYRKPVNPTHYSPRVMECGGQVFHYGCGHLLLAHCGTTALLAACGSVCHIYTAITVYIGRNKMPFFKTYGGFRPAPVCLPSSSSLVEVKSICFSAVGIFIFFYRVPSPYDHS